MSQEIPRQLWESDEMYNLRRRFIQKYQFYGEYMDNRSRLECLAQILINIEFLGCVYETSIMKRVEKMSVGLTRAKIKVVATESSNHLSEHDEISSAAEPNIPQKEAQQPLKRKLGYIASPNDKSNSNNNDFAVPTAAKKLNNSGLNLDDLPTTKNGGFWGQPQAKTVAELKQKSIQNVKAQLTLSLIESQQKASLAKDHVTVLNMACNAAKVAWRVESNHAKIDTQNSVLEYWLTIDGVVVLKMCHLIDEETTKTLMCEKVIDLFRRCTDLEVKRCENDKFELFIKLSGQKEPIGPESYVTEALIKALLQFRDFWIQNKQSFKPKNSQSKSTIIEILEWACEKCFKKAGLAKVSIRRSQGWNEDIFVSICGVEILRRTIKVPNRNVEDEHKLKLCQESSDLILKMNVENCEIERDPITFVCKLIFKQVDEKSKVGGQITNEQREMALLLKRNLRFHENGSKNVAQILHECCLRSRLSLETEFLFLNQAHECRVIVEGLIIGRASGTSKKIAKNAACENSMQILSKDNFDVIKFVDNDGKECVELIVAD